MKIGVELVTGFLGAGKTTLINSLISKTRVENEKILIIQFESGNTLCQFNSNLINCITLSESILDSESVIIRLVQQYKPNRIFLEYNGTEDINDFFYILERNTIDKIIKLNCIYFIADSKNILQYLRNMEEIFVPIIENSNLIIMRNNDMVSENTRNLIRDEIELINSNGHIVNLSSKDSISEFIHKNKYVGRSYLMAAILRLQYLIGECRWNN